MNQAGDMDGAEERRRTIADIDAQDLGQRETLLRGLGDADWRVRKEAARVCAALVEPWGLEGPLVDAIAQDDNVGLRNTALEVFERLGDRSAAPLMAALDTVPDAARKFIVAALGHAGDAGSHLLAKLSDDPEPNTAQAAIEALARVGNATAQATLRRHLAAEHAVQRLAALQGLSEMGAVLELEELRPLLEHRLLARSALRLLSNSEDPAALTILIDALASGSGGSASEATLALGRMLERGGPAAARVAEAGPSLGEPALGTLRSLAEAGGGALRRAAASLLLLARDHASLAVASELAAGDRLPPSARAAIRRWGGDAVPPLLDAARSLAPSAAAAALAIAADLAEEASLDAPTLARLRATLRGSLGADPRTAPTVAQALSTWAELEDVPRLVEAARRFPEDAGPAIARTLCRLAEESPDELGQALSGIPVDGALGSVLLPAIARLGTEDAHATLTTALNATDPRTRRAAVLCLSALDDVEQRVELAGFALADEDLDVQCAAVQALAEEVSGRTEEDRPAGDDPKPGQSRALEQLRVALRSAADPVVAAAARALGAANDRGSIAPLRARVTEARPGVAVAAMESLRTMGDPSLDEVLVEALGQDDEELVKEALRAIAESDNRSRDSRVALALQHSAWDVRQLAVELLGTLGTTEAREALRARSSVEPDLGVRAAIDEALHHASAQED